MTPCAARLQFRLPRLQQRLGTRCAFAVGVLAGAVIWLALWWGDHEQLRPDVCVLGAAYALGSGLFGLLAAYFGDKLRRWQVPRPQFRLRSLFLLTALVAVGCLVGPMIAREVRARFGPTSIGPACLFFGPLPPQERLPRFGEPPAAAVPTK